MPPGALPVSFGLHDREREPTELEDEMRLNLGCGHAKLEGWVNVDHSEECEPDQVLDLERFPWPQATSSVDEIRLSHVLEHLGATPAVFIKVMAELYRVCKSGARIEIIVPHPRHDGFLIDPTHVRPVTAGGLQMFSKAKNREWIAAGRANTPLGLQHDIDFEIRSAVHDLDPAWQARLDAGEVTQAELRHAIRSYSNVVAQTTIVLEAVKVSADPARSLEIAGVCARARD